MESDEEYLMRLSGDGLRPLIKLTRVMEERLNELSRTTDKLKKGMVAPLIGSLALSGLTGIIYFLETEPFISLLTGALAILAGWSWYVLRTTRDRLNRELTDLMRQLDRANFDVEWTQEGQASLCIRWKRKEDRIYA